MNDLPWDLAERCKTLRERRQMIDYGNGDVRDEQDEELASVADSLERLYRENCKLREACRIARECIAVDIELVGYDADELEEHPAIIAIDAAMG